MTASETASGKLRQTERRGQILLELQIAPHVRIADLAIRFAVTPETVRRDLDALSAQGRLARAHGGAVPAPGGTRPGLEMRGRDRMAERMRIGRLAADLVKPGETVMIDAGSTAMETARCLALRGIRCTVVTNALHVALSMGRSDAARVILCPGDYLAAEAAVVGPDALTFLDRYTVDLCLIGASAIDADGVSEAVPGFADIKRRMLARSRKAYMIIDASKFGRRDLDSVAPIGAFAGILTEVTPPPDVEREMRAGGTEIIVAR